MAASSMTDLSLSSSAIPSKNCHRCTRTEVSKTVSTVLAFSSDPPGITKAAIFSGHKNPVVNLQYPRHYIHAGSHVKYFMPGVPFRGRIPLIITFTVMVPSGRTICLASIKLTILARSSRVHSFENHFMEKNYD
jgi:hypothetical protein